MLSESEIKKNQKKLWKIYNDMVLELKEYGIDTEHDEYVLESLSIDFFVEEHTYEVYTSDEGDFTNFEDTVSIIKNTKIEIKEGNYIELNFDDKKYMLNRKFDQIIGILELSEISSDYLRSFSQYKSIRDNIDNYAVNMESDEYDDILVDIDNYRDMIIVLTIQSPEYRKKTIKEEASIAKELVEILAIAIEAEIDIKVLKESTEYYSAIHCFKAYSTEEQIRILKDNTRIYTMDMAERYNFWLKQFVKEQSNL